MKTKNTDGLHSLWADDVHSITIDAIDSIQGNLINLGIDTSTDVNVDLIENDLHSLIIQFLEDNYGSGEYKCQMG